MIKILAIGIPVNQKMMLQHISDVHIETFDDVAPINRQYACEWLGCNKHFGKRKLLKNYCDVHFHVYYDCMYYYN